jgi:ferredoxin-fold anticodon binding domain-containing protein
MKLAETIKPVIEALACPVHDIYPIAQISGDEFKVITCCSVFQKECTEEMEAMLTELNVNLDWSVI